MNVLRVVHTTTFDYGTAVRASYNEARMRPVDDESQRVISARIDVQPHTWTDEYVDYWGTSVTSFEVLSEHERLTIVAESVVERGSAPEPALVSSWTDLGGETVRDAHAAFLTATATTDVPDDVATLALAAAAGLDPVEAAEAVCLAVRDGLEYVPGVTAVHTPAADAWAARKGVCQDMAHLAIGALRSVGIPARYVSGYLHPRGDAAVGEPVQGDSHAWLEFWTGAWTAYDPTNRRFVGTDHVVVARGREYGDVPPLKGVYAGGAPSILDVAVEITRVA
ncbi:transglutaminase domain protein [Xylanimonas cellulosilytica DSM 15894]|uniref:Transglutaminase domain protein n=1 Tax=Xylanimonas cellulosilytica (strain DSM 15894 / JCM 12276 / CECT 5975 / KCTC 9989 / LMG 20990 / NBRC 107835 / XIL07) TaxID=446471 RepID=D1BUY2_XYLCX|nr:transglutaminase family protein [Xylanimonas cellulosilytica]ACZ31221.1 transglutaminase domain protein [Xylanimonas cellulosilytica DSM 15894]